MDKFDVRPPDPATHGVFWLGLMENFAEHQEPFGPKTQKCKVRHS